jgi:hypothetical protein
VSVWKPLLVGTRVKHRHENYEGWIRGTTECHQSTSVNPDGKTQYRIIHFGDNGEEIRLAAETDLSICDEDAVPGPIIERKIAPGRHDNLQLSFNIWALGEYHARPELGNPPRKLVPLSRVKETLPREDSRRTTQSLRHTEMIKSLKRDDPTAIDYFYSQLDGALGANLSIVTVPSSTPNNSNNGLIGLVRKLTQNTRANATACLCRSMKITSSHQAEIFGEDRGDVTRHLDSIRVHDEHLINSKTIALLDDIVKTGASLQACRRILLEIGATKVICLALGSSTW